MIRLPGSSPFRALGLRALRPQTKMRKIHCVVWCVEDAPYRSALDHRSCIRTKAERLDNSCYLIFAFCAA